MRFCPLVFNARHRPNSILRHRPGPRPLLTLAIETSCDDTSVAVVEKTTLSTGHAGATIHFHKKITSNNAAYHGIHPLTSLHSHQENLARLVDESVSRLPLNERGVKRTPDFVAVTRGPGMRSNLSTGLDTAKGLAAAWQTELVGVHHMQAHALTPRLVTALQNVEREADTNGTTMSDSPIPSKTDVDPEFPFLSVLASGGHTLLIQSSSLASHKVLGSTGDIAIGDCLDKVARAVLPLDVVQMTSSTMYGALLEEFAFPETPTESDRPETVVSNVDSAPQNIQQAANHCLTSGTAGEYRAMHGSKYDYEVSKNHEEALVRSRTRWGWGFTQPLAKAAGGVKSKTLEMSFSGLLTAVERVVRYRTNTSTGKITRDSRSALDISVEERKDLARESMRAAFEHVASRVILGLQQTEDGSLTQGPAVVMAGGVAANSYLRYIIASTLCAQGYADVNLVFPPPSLCTDNAAMIAWAGLEMYQAGYKDPRSIRALRKWPLDQILAPPTDG